MRIKPLKTFSFAQMERSTGGSSGVLYSNGSSMEFANDGEEFVPLEDVKRLLTAYNESIKTLKKLSSCRLMTEPNVSVKDKRQFGNFTKEFFLRSELCEIALFRCDEILSEEAEANDKQINLSLEETNELLT